MINFMNTRRWFSLFAALGIFSASAAEADPAAQPATEPAPAKKSKKTKEAAPAKVYPTMGKIERFDPALDALIAPGANIEKLAEGFEWAEGPIWIKKEEALYFSDVPRNVIFRWREGEKTREIIDPSGYTGKEPRGGEPGSNGLTLDAKGNLILCQHGDRQVARYVNGKFVPLVRYYQGRRFNSPNDLVYHSNGDLYFTDPPYGLLKKNDDPAKELVFNGVYRLKPNGKLTLLTSGLTYPNGIALSPDQKTLYVAISDPANPLYMAYDVKPDGTITNERVFFDATHLHKQGLKGLPDGIKIDIHGNLWGTGPGGVLVISPQGKHLGTINTGEATANCGWGNDGTVLYITADMYLCRVQTLSRGPGFGRNK